MAVYSFASRTPAAAAGAAYADLVAGAADRARVREIGFFVTAATATSVALVRAATLGTRTTPTLGAAMDAADGAAAAGSAVAWSVAPTISSNVHLRRTIIPAAIGNGFIWTFGPNDLLVPLSGGLLLWNYGSGAGSISDFYIMWEE